LQRSCTQIRPSFFLAENFFVGGRDESGYRFLLLAEFRHIFLKRIDLLLGFFGIFIAGFPLLIAMRILDF
jgi:hypothetical protein